MMHLTTAILLLATTLVLSSLEMARAGKDGFYAEGYVSFDNSLEGNTDIIGAHLHTGSSTTNGPVNIAFCGSGPLPDVLNVNGPCTVTEKNTDEQGRYTATWEATVSDPDVEFKNGGNDATSVSGATTLADGASTTLKSLKETLMSCTSDECDVYFNIHTNYSFNLNAGAYGLARGQLQLLSECPVTLKPGYDYETAKCFGATVNSASTNMVEGIPNQLAENAGKVTPILGEVLVIYQGGNDDVEEEESQESDVADPENPLSDDFPQSASLLSSSSFLFAAAVTISLLLISPFMMML